MKPLAWLKCYGHRTGDAACIRRLVYLPVRKFAVEVQPQP